MRCNCSQQRKLIQTGVLDPPGAGWICPCCKKEYHQYILSKVFKKQPKNMGGLWTYNYKVKPEYEKVFD